MNRRTLLRSTAGLTFSGFLTGCVDTIDGEATPPEQTPCPMPEFDAIESDDYDRIEPFEKAVFERVNESRASQGLTKLEWDGVLAYISRLHSKDMATSGFIGHEDEKDRGPSYRIRKFNYPCISSYAENIVVIPSINPSQDDLLSVFSKKCVQSWADSPEHRRTMWSKAGGVAGVGCYINADNDVYVTNLFCTHDPADVEDAGTGTPPEDCYYGGEPP